MSDQPLEDWELLVRQILAGDPAGQQSLFKAFGHGLRVYFMNHLRRQDVDDLVHDTFISVVSAIRAEQLRDPARLPGYIRTVARRQIAGYVAEAVRQRGESVELTPELHPAENQLNPEQEVIEQQRAQLAARILKALPESEREILVRFYFDGQPPEQICAELGLTPTQFRLRKSRGKERLARLIGKSLRREKLFGEFLLRKGAASGH